MGGALYRALAPSGPNQSSGPQSPETDDGTYWINESDIVHRYGDEEITGIKTYTGDTIYKLPDSFITIPPTQYVGSGDIEQKVCDSNGNVAACMGFVKPTTENSYQSIFYIAVPNFSTDGSTYGSSSGIQLKNGGSEGAYVRMYRPCSADSNHPYFYLSNNSVSGVGGVAPSSNRWSQILFMGDDISGKNFGQVGFSVETDNGCRLRLSVNKNSSEAKGASIDFKYFGTDYSNFFPMEGSQLGDGSHRWGQFFTTTAPNISSDERKKQNIDIIPDEVLDAWGNVSFLQFKFKESVQKKGIQNARLHNGLIAQRVEDAFHSRNLDARKYGLFCWDEWNHEDADIDENGNIMTPEQEAGEEYSIRYEEALCMEAAYQRRENRRLKDRVSELENKVLQLEDKLNQLLNK